MTMRRLGRVAAVLAVMACAAAALGGPVAAASERFGMWVDVGDSCFRGAGPAGTRIAFELRTAGGSLKGRTKVRVSTDGRFMACIEGGAGMLLPTDVLTGRLGDRVRRLSIPALGPHVDRQRDLVSGWARPGELVDVTMVVDRDLRGTVSTVAGSDGRWVADVGRAGQAGAEFTATIHRGLDRVSAIGRAILVELRAGSAVVSGIAGAPDGVHLALLDPTGRRRATAEAQVIDFPPMGDFGTVFADRSGTPVVPRPGDRVVDRATGVDLVVPRTAVAAVAGTRTVTGHCGARQRWTLDVSSRTEGNPGSIERHGKADASGRLSIVLDLPQPLAIGDDLRLTCRLPSRDTITVIGGPGLAPTS